MLTVGMRLPVTLTVAVVHDGPLTGWCYLEGPMGVERMVKVRVVEKWIREQGKAI